LTAGFLADTLLLRGEEVGAFLDAFRLAGFVVFALDAISSPRQNKDLSNFG
jgi:hypothetical protein